MIKFITVSEENANHVTEVNVNCIIKYHGYTTVQGARMTELTLIDGNVIRVTDSAADITSRINDLN